MILDINHAQLEILLHVHDRPNSSERDVLLMVPKIENKKTLVFHLDHLTSLGLLKTAEEGSHLYSVSILGQVVIGKAKPNDMLAKRLKDFSWEYPITHEVITKRMEAERLQLLQNSKDEKSVTAVSKPSVNTPSQSDKKQTSIPETAVSLPIPDTSKKEPELPVISDVDNGGAEKAILQNDAPLKPARKPRGKNKVKQRPLDFIPESSIPTPGTLDFSHEKSKPKKQLAVSVNAGLKLSPSELEIVSQLASGPKSYPAITLASPAMEALSLRGFISFDDKYSLSPALTLTGNDVAVDVSSTNKIMDVLSLSRLERSVIDVLLSNEKHQISPGKLSLIIELTLSDLQGGNIAESVKTIIANLNDKGLVVYRNNNMFYLTKEARCIFGLTRLTKPALDKIKTSAALVELMNQAVLVSEELMQSVGVELKTSLDKPASAREAENNVSTKKQRKTDSKTAANAEDQKAPVLLDNEEPYADAVADVSQAEAEVATAVEVAQAEPEVDAAVEVAQVEPEVDAAVEVAQAEPEVDAAVEVAQAEPEVDATVEVAQAEPGVDAAVEVAQAEPEVDAAVEVGQAEVVSVVVNHSDLSGTDDVLLDELILLQNNLRMLSGDKPALIDKKIAFLDVLMNSPLTQTREVKAIIQSMINDYEKWV